MKVKTESIPSYVRVEIVIDIPSFEGKSADEIFRLGKEAAKQAKKELGAAIWPYVKFDKPRTGQYQATVFVLKEDPSK